MKITQISQKSELSKDIFDDAWFFHIAEDGAMGAFSNVTIITKHAKGFNFSYAFGDITFDDVLTFFPSLNEFNSFLGEIISVPKGWQHVYMGAGNHLLISDEIYDKFYEETKENVRSIQIYGNWIEKAEQIIKSTKIGTHNAV